MSLCILRLQVTDLRRSVAFWREVLGDGPEGDGYSVTTLEGRPVVPSSAIFHVGQRMRLALHQAEGAVAPGDTVLSFEVEDLEERAARLVALGARVAGEVLDHGEVRDQLLLDPDGHRIELHQWR